MSDPVLRVQDLAVNFISHTGGLLRRKERVLRAVNGISFELHAGETIGIVGESGSGKSTLARAILGLIQPCRGRVMWLGENLTELDEEALRQKRKEIQIVFQDPFASLDPRVQVGKSIGEGLKIHGIGNPKERQDKILEVLKLVGLEENHANRYPHEFSGGQRQRIGIARALILNPKLM